MDENKKKDNRQGENAAAQQEDFMVHEWKERDRIETQSRQLKESIDQEKEDWLEAIDRQHEDALEEMRALANQLESTLEGGEPEKIKEMLRNIQ